jgi:DNA-binding NarL/FixJ family response regulator
MRYGSTLSDVARVLLVDDNEEMLARSAAVLGPACEIVGAVKDGAAALEAAEALHPDVIVLDISMPGMTGLEVASTLHNSGSKAAVVFLTVHDEGDVIRAASGVGGLGYVLKRRLASDLVFAVQEALAGRPFVSTTHH